MSVACFLRLCVSVHPFLENSAVLSSALVGRCWGGEGLFSAGTLAFPPLGHCPWLPVPWAPPLPQLVCLRSCARLVSVGSTGSRASFRAGPFKYRVLTVCSTPALSLGLPGRDSALSTLCPSSVALKCPPPLSLQSLWGGSGFQPQAAGSLQNSASVLLQVRVMYGFPASLLILWWCVSCLFSIVGLFLKSLLTSLQCCFHFVSWRFGCQTCGLLAPQPRIEPAPLALEGLVLAAGPRGKALFCLFCLFTFEGE